MTKEEVKKQEKRIAKFNGLNKELEPYKAISKALTPESVEENIRIGIGHTYGGDTCISVTKNGSTIGSVNVNYDKYFVERLIEIVGPIIFNKVKELEEKIEKI